MENLKMNTSSGQVYINNKCLHQDGKGYYTISTTKFAGRKIQIRKDITDPIIIEQIEKFLTN
jgi:hypothetical protein